MRLDAAHVKPVDREEMRRAWVGLSVPLAPIETGPRASPTRNVLSGPRTFLQQLFAPPPRLEYGYVLDSEQALALLADKDATLIRFFRALFREHKVSSDLWTKMVEGFGRQRTIEMMALMGDYFIVGTMMNAVDQHLPPTRQPLLPSLTRGR